MPFRGVVEKGGGYGRRLGFPTANIPLTDDSVSGIYAAKVRFGGGAMPAGRQEYNAAVYADTKRKLLEAHVLHFDDDVYGMEMEIELLKKMRDDKEFADEDEARAQIANDVREIEEWLRMR